MRDVLTNLGLSSYQGAIAITDRAPAWSVPLTEVKANHIYDTFHFNRDITTHSTDEREKFMMDMRKAVFHIFDNDEKINQHISMIESYATNDGSSLMMGHLF